MEVLLGYLLGIGTVAAIARRGDTAKSAIAWAARQAGALSGKVAASLDRTAQVAREEYQRGREEQLERPPAPGLEVPVTAPSRPLTHLNGN